MALLIEEDIYLISEIFWLLSGILPISPGFPIKVQVKGRHSTPGGGNKAISKEETCLVRRGIPGV